MNHILKELPPMLRTLGIRRREVLVLALPQGYASVEIEEMYWCKNFCTFAGKVDDEQVRGYFDFESGQGGIMSV